MSICASGIVCCVTHFNVQNFYEQFHVPILETQLYTINHFNHSNHNKIKTAVRKPL